LKLKSLEFMHAANSFVVLDVDVRLVLAAEGGNTETMDLELDDHNDLVILAEWLRPIWVQLPVNRVRSDLVNPGEPGRKGESDE
jgi:hypothetical protein